MFHVPISAPTASRMKIAPTAVVTPPTAASATEATVYPFLNAIKLAKAALRNRAICNGPSVAPTPKMAMVVAMSAIRTAIGRTASSSVDGIGRLRSVSMDIGDSPPSLRSVSDIGELLGAGTVRRAVCHRAHLLRPAAGRSRSRVGSEADERERQDPHDDATPDASHPGTSLASQRAGRHATAQP